jgi:putative phosphoribosyl transferase
MRNGHAFPALPTQAHESASMRRKPPLEAFVAPVEIVTDTARLHGELALPGQPRGIVVFAHGSGSSRHSPRNAYVAGVLREAGLATLLFDLLTAAEDRDYATRFDIALLTARLVAATQWVLRDSPAADLPLGYFGASTGAAAALAAAAELRTRIGAVVSRGGRPDLTGAAALRRVSAPTLLIVGGNDPAVIEMNREAYADLGCVKALRIVPGATHLFEEPGTLEQVATAASEWFARCLGATRPADDGAAP